MAFLLLPIWMPIADGRCRRVVDDGAMGEEAISDGSGRSESRRFMHGGGMLWLLLAQRAQVGWLAVGRLVR